MLDARRGAIWLFDEVNGSSRNSAVGEDALSLLKSLMTRPSIKVRLYHTQNKAEASLNHAWYATGRT